MLIEHRLSCGNEVSIVSRMSQGCCVTPSLFGRAHHQSLPPHHPPLAHLDHRMPSLPILSSTATLSLLAALAFALVSAFFFQPSSLIIPTSLDATSTSSSPSHAALVSDAMTVPISSSLKRMPAYFISHGQSSLLDLVISSAWPNTRILTRRTHPNKPRRPPRWPSDAVRHTESSVPPMGQHRQGDQGPQPSRARRRFRALGERSQDRRRAQ